VADRINAIGKFEEVWSCGGYSEPRESGHRLVSRASTLGLPLLAQIVIPNIVGALSFLAG